jgi:hypothetical protein
LLVEDKFAPLDLFNLVAANYTTDEIGYQRIIERAEEWLTDVVRPSNLTAD